MEVTMVKKRDDGIRLSEQHGLNPSLEKCHLCGEAAGVVLFGRLPLDVKAPESVCVSGEPCARCKEIMSVGVVLISVLDGSSGDAPYRTGGWAVVRPEAVARLFDKKAAAAALKHRVAYVEDSAWNALGLPRTAADIKAIGAPTEWDPAKHPK